MNDHQQRIPRRFRYLAGALTAITLLALAGCAHLMMMHGHAEPPPASEFGFGPRLSSNGLFRATIEPTEPFRVRQMHTVKLTVETNGLAANESSAPLSGAAIGVDGGMPQHGHGLPTRPRVTRELGAGTYQVDGVRFNMGGWWELKFLIDSEAGVDSVTFNLDL